jgi:hypothetical protein
MSWMLIRGLWSREVEAIPSHKELLSRSVPAPTPSQDKLNTVCVHQGEEKKKVLCFSPRKQSTSIHYTELQLQNVHKVRSHTLLSSNKAWGDIRQKLLKGKLVNHHVMKTYGAVKSEGIAPPYLTMALDGRVVSFTPRQLYPPGKEPAVPIG